MKPHKKQWALKWTEEMKANYIGGSFFEGTGEAHRLEDPYSQGPISNLKCSSTDDVNSAIEAAAEAHRDGRWRKMNMRKRAKIMQQIGQLARDHQDELATLETLCNGKTYKESYFDDLPDSADVFDYYAGWIGKINGQSLPVEDGFHCYTKKEPRGVCALIVPWNFPLLLACWKMATALAAGNTIIVKPSEYTPLSLIRFFELIDEKVPLLPKGVINMVIGGARVGSALSEHQQVDKVSFTGSTSVGRAIVTASAESNLKAVTLELGGKSPNIIFADAPDLDAAIERSFSVMFSNKGEKCSEPTRLLVEETIYERVLEGLRQRAEKVVLGDPFDDGTDQGPQCYRGHYERILMYIKSGIDEGARLISGGLPDAPATNGYFVRPTIFADVDNKMRIAQEEIFGPVLAVIPFKTEEEAIAIANDSNYGLAAGLWSKDINRAQRVAEQLDAGQVYINRYGCYEFSAPFGGYKLSGWGKEMGLDSLEAFTKTKAVWLHYS